MRDEDEKPEPDTLFLACTRPAMIGGVTMEAMAVTVMLSCVLFLVLGSLKYAAVGVVIHVVCKLILRHDHNAFRILKAWLDTRGRQRNTSYWGGSSVTPLRLVRHYDTRDLGDV
jgi:type IV secretion system protein VirB3